MSIGEIRLLDRDLTNDRISMPYPNLQVLNATDAVALMLQSFPEGELPVICEHNGSTRQLCCIKKSAVLINALLRVTPIVFNKDVGTQVTLKSAIDVLEVL